MSGIDTIAVVGAGRMGHGIALVYALDDHSVVLNDADAARLDSCQDRIAEAIDTLVDAGRVSETDARRTMDRIDPVDRLERAVRDADLITEAVTEDLSIKQSIFEELDRHAPESAILATNTSSLSIDRITEPVDRRDRVLGTHWFNPPYIVPLVEIVKGSETSDRMVNSVSSVLDSAGKTPVVVQEDIPGFIGNRIQAAMSYEAFSLLERGVATPADIDKAVKASFGFRLPIMGIFSKMDQSGLDIHYEVEAQLMPELDRGTEPNAVIEELLAGGETGTDAGKGVYDWTETDLDAVYRERDQALLNVLEVYESSSPTTPPANYDRTGD